MYNTCMRNKDYPWLAFEMQAVKTLEFRQANDISGLFIWKVCIEININCIEMSNISKCLTIFVYLKYISKRKPEGIYL